MNVNEIEMLKHHVENLEIDITRLQERNVELQRIADAKPAELNAEMMDEVESLRERAKTLEGDLMRHESMLARSRHETDDMRRERDKAIAHDTQDYPTADAYDRVCKARLKWLDILSAARTMIADAEKECGGDGKGCKGWQGSATRCIHCSMTQIAEMRELMK